MTRHRRAAIPARRAFSRCSVVVLALAIAGAASPAPQKLADDVVLIPGGIEPGRQPDGNSIVFRGQQGLVVVDTGRHAAHRGRIEAFAARAKLPIVAIVNTHWHLDHVSGNIALRAAYPQAKVYAGRGIDGALTGFLARSREQMRQALADPKLDPVTAEEMRTDLATIEAGTKLRPDVVIERSTTMRLAGRSLSVRLARKAATETDVWIYDPATRLAVVGDLVTLPAPFFDTACPQGWQQALTEVAATPFRTLVPGHGAPMNRVQFTAYRRGFNRLLGCAASDASPARCADGWIADAGALIGTDDRERRLARRMIEYYVGSVLRTPDARSKRCAPAY